MAITETQQAAQTLPTPGTWALDTTHTDVSFTARHLMVTKVRGRFPVQRGEVTIAREPARVVGRRGDRRGRRAQRRCRS